MSRSPSVANPFGRRDGSARSSRRSRVRQLLSPHSAIAYPVPRDGLGFGVRNKLPTIKGVVLHIRSGYCINPTKGLVYGRTGFLIGTVCRDGYVRCGGVQGPPSTWYAHRLVWESVNGDIPRGMHVDHMNAKRADNRIKNLQLLTPAENCAMTCVRGNCPRGEQKHNAKLDAAKVRSIRRSSESARVLANRYGVNTKTIRQARSYQTWRHVVTKVRRQPPSKRKS